MPLYRFPLIPESAWRTPWQSDTLAGMICGAVAQLEGGEALRRKIIDPALAGRPPFVLSDAFPGDWLPVPAFTRLLDWPPDQRKTVKRPAGSNENHSSESATANLSRWKTSSMNRASTKAPIYTAPFADQAVQCRTEAA